jgi:hypothetical protein
MVKQFDFGDLISSNQLEYDGKDATCGWFTH